MVFLLRPRLGLKTSAGVWKPTDEENLRGRWTKLHNEEIHNIAIMITTRRVKWVGFVTLVGSRRTAEGFGRKA
jgi:hypothetical protein